VVSAWLLAHWINWPVIKQILLWPGAILGVLTAVYSGFLFAQAKGRDFWQSPLTPIHLFIQAVVAGAAALLIGLFVMDASSELIVPLSITLMIGLAANALTILGGELGVTHASVDAKTARNVIVKGELSKPFWGLAILMGNVIPIALVLAFGTMPGVIALAAGLSLLGLLAYEHIWVVAGQWAPLS
jgi:formate-dependent nitrite reductase membrane component NrfD